MKIPLYLSPRTTGREVGPTGLLEASAFDQACSSFDMHVAHPRRVQATCRSQMHVSRQEGGARQRTPALFWLRLSLIQSGCQCTLIDANSNPLSLLGGRHAGATSGQPAVDIMSGNTCQAYINLLQPT